MTTFIIGFLLTVVNGHGILLSRKRYIPLHVVGAVTGCLLMAQEVLKQF